MFVLYKYRGSCLWKSHLIKDVINHFYVDTLDVLYASKKTLIPQMPNIDLKAGDALHVSYSQQIP